jgi:ATP-dependent Clp protease ATP-binding subunit ClpC
MFERYTEKARRVIFFARYEASNFGSPLIETEHMLLGLLREDKAMTNRFLRSHVTVESIRRQIETHTTIREKVSTSVDLPLSDESKRVLTFAAEEAEGLGHKHIGSEHLLLGLLREENSFAAKILAERGLQLGTVREELKGMTSAASVVSASGFRAGASPFPTPSGMFKDLTQAAMNGDFESLVGRAKELDAMVEALCSRRRRNVLLIGERGVGRSALVHGLVQRIVEGTAPAPLQGKGVLSIEPDLLVSWARDRHFDGLVKLLASTPRPKDMILFIHGGEGFLASALKTAGLNPGIVIRVAIQAGARCIGTGTIAEYQAACEVSPWLNEFFRPIFINQLDEAQTLLVVHARKEGLETFHEVTFSEEALSFAAQWAAAQSTGVCSPGTALELLDAAGGRVKLREQPVPEIAEQQRRLNLIAKREADAISNHEFEKARFYSDEARKERESLEAMCARHGVTATPSTHVERRDLEEVIASWSQYPYTV